MRHRHAGANTSACRLEQLENRLLFARPLGIDVSNHQGDITLAEWQQIKASGRDFAFCKATEGVTFNDAEFTDNMTRAKQAGVLIGAYHFGRPDNNTAVAEANHFVSIITPYLTSGYLRPVLDIETDAGDVTFMSNWVNDFNNRVKTLTGITPIVYTGQSFASTNFNSSVTQWPLWMARWPTNPDPQNGNPGSTTPWGAWAFWQYSDAVAVPGAGTVDADVFNGTLAQLQANYTINANPEVTVLRGATGITNGQLSPIDFGIAMQNQPGPSITFTVRNDGGAALTLGPVSVPSNYTLTEPLLSSLASGASDTFTVQLNTPSIGLFSGNVSFTTNDSDENPFTFPITGAVIPADTTPPQVSSSSFVYATTPHKLTFGFSESVQTSLSFDDLVVEDLTHGTTLPTNSFTMSYNAADNTATFTYVLGVLPDASYRATLPANRVQDAAGNPLSADYVLEFKFLSGDANNDGAVNLLDFNTLASNFGQSGRDFTQGDFNYDGTVDLIDFNILAGNFGTSVSPGTFSGSRIRASTGSRAMDGVRDDGLA
jgi:GH25 family lysozyme M1 (1,4-beta-N-acetylmuramidase)